MKKILFIAILILTGCSRLYAIEYQCRVDLSGNVLAAGFVNFRSTPTQNVMFGLPYPPKVMGTPSGRKTHQRWDGSKWVEVATP